jgi:Arc/MetJ-type ribon-helix-helix transcriptional regulator
MSTEYSAESERYLRQLVERGVYHDRAAAIDEAVALLKRRDQLRADVCLGIEQADRGELNDSEGVFQLLEERARQIEAQARTRK